MECAASTCTLTWGWAGLSTASEESITCRDGVSDTHLLSLQTSAAEQAGEHWPEGPRQTWSSYEQNVPSRQSSCIVQ